MSASRESSSQKPTSMPAVLDSSVLNGAIMPVINEEFAQGRHFKAIRICADLANIFHQNRQLDELWAWQISCRTLWLRHAKSAVIRAKAKNQIGHNIEATFEIDYIKRVLQHCQEQGIFTNVGYLTNWTGQGNLHSTNTKALAGLCWRRYMLKHISSKPDGEVAALLKSFEEKYAVVLQARLRRFLNWKTISAISASFRRIQQQRQFFLEPIVRRDAQNMIVGHIRRKLLMLRLAALKAACSDLHIARIEKDALDPITRQALKHRYESALSCQSTQSHYHRHQTRLEISNDLVHFCLYPFPRAMCVGPLNFSNAVEGKQIQKIDIAELASTRDFTDSTQNIRNKGGDIGETEVVVGLDIVPKVGMRVKFRKQALIEFPDLIVESGGGIGTITWVDPDDLDGDGITGDICSVKWDKTGIKDNYRTGFEGQYRLEQVKQLRKRDSTMGDNEKVVGADVEPKIGLRVVLRKQELERNSFLAEDSGGGPGTITWIDAADLDDDGIPGDICTVLWDRTGIKKNYHIGYFRDFQLMMMNSIRSRVSDISGKELIVGLDVVPEVGMRVILCQQALEEFPELVNDSGKGIGTIVWVDPEDLDGDGVTGDICSVIWDNTGIEDDYRTGHEGQYRLAKFVQAEVQLSFSPRCCWAGLNIQRVFRGFLKRKYLRQELISRFILADEISHVDNISASVLRIQNAVRMHNARVNVRFQKMVKSLAGDQQRAAVEMHDKALLKVQSVFRGHRVRSDFKAMMITKQLIERVQERTLNKYIENPEKTLYHSRVVKCRWRIKAWRHVCRRKTQFQQWTLTIIATHECNARLFVLKRWMHHHEIFLRQQECAQKILHCLASALVGYQVQTAFHGWNQKSVSARWFKEKFMSALRLEKKNLSATIRWILQVLHDHMLLSRSQNVACKAMRAKPLSRLSRFIFAEWHATAHRRRDVKAMASFILPLWSDFMLYRCFVALKQATSSGSIANSSSLISMLKLQSKLSSVTKGATSVIQRFSNEHELNRVAKGLPICKTKMEADSVRLAAASAANENLFAEMKNWKEKEYPSSNRAGQMVSPSRVPGFWEERSKMMLTESTLWRPGENSTLGTFLDKQQTPAVVIRSKSTDVQMDVSHSANNDNKIRKTLPSLKPLPKSNQLPREGPNDTKLPVLALPMLKPPSTASSSSSQHETNRKFSNQDRDIHEPRHSWLPSLQTAH